MPLTGRRGEIRGTTVVDVEDLERLQGSKWHLTAQGYAASMRHERGDGTLGFALMHRVLLGLKAGDGMFADHINRDRLDNRRANLRVLTPSESPSNRAFQGVSWNERLGKWHAYTHQKWGAKRKHLGFYESRADAERIVAVAGAGGRIVLPSRLPARGVYFDKASRGAKKWRVRIRGKYVGMYLTREEAETAARNAQRPGEAKR